MKKKVAIISPGGLPIPNVRGGAVETGIQQIIDENERRGWADITVYSIADEKAECAANTYKNTKIIFINESLYCKWNTQVRRIFNGIFRHLMHGRIRIVYRYQYINEVRKKIEKECFDVVLIKNAVDFVEVLRPVVKTQLYLQIHNDFLNANTYHAKKIYDMCDLVITNSNYLKQQVLTIESSKAEKIAVNKNCTEVERFSRCNLIEEKYTSWKQKLKVEAGEKVILYSGRINSDKGVLELAQAVVQIPDGIKYRLVLMGSKWYGKNTSDEYALKVEKVLEPIRDNVSILGFVPYEDVPYVYNCADILVVPSQWEEPAGRIVIEGQASGVALIISDAGGMREYINQNSAIVVKRDKTFVNSLRDEIIDLLTNDAVRTELMTNAVKCAQNYTTERYYREIMEILGQEETE